MRRYVGALPATFLLLGFGGAAIGSASLEPIGNEIQNYSYDARGRLVQVRHDDSVNDNVVANYSYDGANNRDAVTVVVVPDFYF